MAERGEFRQDLLYRLGAFCLELPPLRERDGDIQALLDWRLATHTARSGSASPMPSPEYLELLLSHHWPGNVRELLQTVDMSLVSAHGERVLLPQHLPLELRVRLMRGRVASGAFAAAPPLASTVGGIRPWRVHRAGILEKAEKDYFAALMAFAGGDSGLASELSGLKSARLYELLGKHGLVRGKRVGMMTPEIPE
jgi:Transcriptional regulator containing PAS, AAA-type ATPase, and DNA-binding domains